MRRSSMDVALIQPWWSRSSLLEQHMRNRTSNPCKKDESGDSRFQPLLCTRQKREEQTGKRSKRNERPANKWKAVEEEISIRQGLVRMLQKVLALRAGSSLRCRRMKTCERGWREGGDWQERERKTAGERTQRPFVKQTARRRIQAPLKVDVIGWTGGEFKKSGRKREVEEKEAKEKEKNNVKHRKRKRWKKCKELIISREHI